MKKSLPPIGRRTFLAGALGAAVAGTAAACTFGDQTPDGSGTNQTDDEGTALMVLRQSMPPVAHLDSHVGNPGSASGNILQAGLQEGLLVVDAEGAEALPGVAESWSVSDDGLVYTLPLRTDAKWSNGDPVVAEDFVWNWERFISPETPREGNPPYNPNVGVAGARAFANGETTDFSTVGVKALDEHTLEITLESPSPDFPFYLAAWQTMPVHPGTVEEFPDSWATPENWVGNGPFVMESWQPNASAVLVPNPEYWDKDTYHIDRWEIRFSDAGDSAAMLSYSADEIDLFRIEGDLAAVMSDPALAEELQISKSNQWRCLFMMSSHNTTLHDVRVRKALSLAIDREVLAELTQPDVPAGSLVPDAVPGYDEIPQIEFDLDQAKSLLAEAGYPNGEGMPALQLLLPRPTPWVEAIAGMWQENLGVQANVDLVEAGVFTQQRMAPHPEDYCGFVLGNFGVNPPSLYQAATMSIGQRFGDMMMPAAALEEIRAIQDDESLEGPEKNQRIQEIRDAETFPEWQAYADLVAQAEAELDADARQELLVQTAIAREESYFAIPVLWGGYTLMVKPRVQNLEVQPFPTVFRLAGVDVTE